MSEKSVHVVLNRTQNRWTVKKSDAQQARSVSTGTKEEAIRLGRIISQRSGSNLFIHEKDGKIRLR